ncbi:lytic murein transglycosylase [Octadecabacter sp. 1_MG-2023]|uniref:lytic murein transglycosylase n=1 Tax=unclassified Octadecabacter TaxID=196158 RepID=UPI001C08787A|nr:MULTISPECIES: lytic murein transglycosylase [unclassified Octadecabacter]MBU2992462.1 lytic murein transglycosylase [Octadecabacter sp. B2R22]MDO6734782.1 lytic murein transglycosylase [Octadecabacter sp. 1_MG-2023]
MFRFGLVLLGAVSVSGQGKAGPIPPEAPAQTSPLVQVQSSGQSFDRWVDGFRRRALRQGISGATFDAAFQGVTQDDAIITLDRNQSEFSKALWEYLDTAVSAARIRNGQRALRDHQSVLTRIEATYGVDKEVIVAIWGLESAYGAVRGNTNTIEALATLAHDSRRSGFFEGQLLAALQILEAGDTEPRNMVGSWAGAMGHTQFMPTSFLDLAVDGNGDGRRDIWNDDPTDALASAANYLRSNGWTHGQPWGVEVQLPANFDYMTARRDNERMPSDWASDGVVALNGQPVPNHGRASILLPGGHEGAALMIFKNFEVLETYNTADSYVIGVGHLADRIAGGGAIQSAWPRIDGALSGPDRRELQQRLHDAGFDPQAIDGRIGPLTINAIRAYQLANGLVPDGYASPQLLRRLR